MEGQGAGARENMGREGYGKRDLNEDGKGERNSKRKVFVIFLPLMIDSQT